MKTPPAIGLRFCVQVLGAMAERNKRIIDNSNWRKATEGIAGLLKDIEDLRGYRNVIVPVDFSEPLPALDDPRQLKLKLRIA